MKRGQHAADDGSFARSASVNPGRAAALIVASLVIGFLLLHDLDKSSSGTSLTANRPHTTSPPATSPLPTLPTTTTTPVHAPKDVKVLVVNGTTTSGAAARVAQTLKVGGYNVLRAVDASASVKAATKVSAVYYVTRDYERDAKALQTALAIPPTPVQVVPTPPPAAETLQANVVIVVGPDLAKNGPATSSTTRLGATTTRVSSARATTTTR